MSVRSLRRFLPLFLVSAWAWTGCARDAVAPDAAPADEAAAPPLASAAPSVPDLTGTWNGLVSFVSGDIQIMQPDDEEEEIDIGIRSQRGRRIFGSKTMFGTELDIAGTIAANGSVHLVGDGVGTSPGAIQAKYLVETFDGGAAALIGTVQFQNDAGRAGAGQILLRQFALAAGDTPPSLAGPWTASFLSGIDGESMDDRHLVLESVAGEPARLRGTLQFRYGAIPLEGSVDADGNVVLLALAVGVMPCYVVLLTGELDTQSFRLAGSYRVFEAIAPNVAIGPSMVLQDFGSFEIVTAIVID